jgi:hypothetical protein
MNRIEVMEKLQPICQTTVRQVEHSPRTRVVVQPDRVILRPGSGGRLIPLGEDGVRAMASFIGMPRAMCRNLRPDLFGKVATELLSRKERYNLLIDDGEIRDFAGYHGVHNLPAERVVSTIEQAIRGAEFHRVTILGNYSAMLEVVGDQRQAVRRGDLVRAGAIVTFSPIGTVRPLVQSYVLRLACTNGMTSKTVLAEYHSGGEGDNIWQWFRQSVQSACQALGEIVNRYQEMTRERIPADQRAAMLEALLKEAKISGEDAEAVRARAMEEPPRNTYDLLNLVTWASSHVIRKPHRIQRTLDTAASFTAEQEHARICPVCHARR